MVPQGHTKLRILPLILAIIASSPASVSGYHEDPEAYILVKETPQPDGRTTTDLPTFEKLREDFPEIEEEPVFNWKDLTMDQVKKFKTNIYKNSFHVAKSLGSYVKKAEKWFKAGTSKDFSKVHGTVALLCSTGFKFAPKKLQDKLSKVFKSSKKWMPKMTESCALVGAIGDLVVGMQEDKSKIQSLNETLSDLKVELEELKEEIENLVQLVTANLRRLASKRSVTLYGTVEKKFFPHRNIGMEALAVQLQESMNGVEQQTARIVMGTENIAKDTLRMTKVMMDQEKKINYGLCWKDARHVTNEGLVRWYYYNYHQTEGGSYSYFQTFKEFHRIAWWCIDWEQPACTVHISSMDYMDNLMGPKYMSLMRRIYKNHFKYLYACHHTKVNFRKTCLLYRKFVKKSAALGCYIVQNIDLVDSRTAVSLPLYESDVNRYINRSIGVHYPFEAFGCHMKPNHYYPSCNISSIFEPY